LLGATEGSGGDSANAVAAAGLLSAVKMLTAMFLSAHPFRILGEVDAPLDEAIIERHARLSRDVLPNPPSTPPQPATIKKLGITRQIGAYCPFFMRTISLKLPDDLLAQLDSEARARRITKSAFVRESPGKNVGQTIGGGHLVL